MSVLTGQTLWKYSPQTQYRLARCRRKWVVLRISPYRRRRKTGSAAGGRTPAVRRSRLEVAMAWILWLVAAAGLGVAEFFTLALGFGLLAAAAAVAAVTAGLGAPLFIQ